mmetsp:Transcript_16832/g.26283  ORF Transcript_16832/g.26283 Transcript_16832/m.26283 type:complete len:127 (-) Transcript_16832:973-1353(-)
MLLFHLSTGTHDNVKNQINLNLCMRCGKETVIVGRKCFCSSVALYRVLLVDRRDDTHYFTYNLITLFLSQHIVCLTLTQYCHLRELHYRLGAPPMEAATSDHRANAYIQVDAAHLTLALSADSLFA